MFNTCETDEEWEATYGTQPYTDEELLFQFKQHQINLIGFDPAKPVEDK